MERDETLDTPANRGQFLDQVARGVDHDVAAKALGMGGAFTARRYAKANPVFGQAFKEAKRQGLQARRAPERRAKQAARAADKAAKKAARATMAAAPKKPKPKPVKKACAPTKKTRAQRAKKKAEAERDRAAAKKLAESAAAVPSHTWLEEAEIIQPEGLNLNPHLPPLSVQSHLGMCQRMAYDRSEPSAIRREAMRQIGMHTLLPALRPAPAPSRNETGTVAEAQQPALAIPGSGPRVVVLKAPDNGMYAPGCGPGDATVVDEAEAADAELVTAAK